MLRLRTIERREDDKFELCRAIGYGAKISRRGMGFLRVIVALEYLLAVKYKMLLPIILGARGLCEIHCSFNSGRLRLWTGGEV